MSDQSREQTEQPPTLREEVREGISLFREVYRDVRSHPKVEDVHPVALPVIIVIAAIVVMTIHAAIEMVDGETNSGNPPPEVSAIKKMNLLMPVRVGQHGTAAVWPPFWGHRFPLGCRR